VKPAPFDYVAASSVDEAVALLANHGDDAKLIAGGQSLIPMLNFRLLQPDMLIDIGNIPDLQSISEATDSLLVGATVCHHMLLTSPLVRKHFPILCHAVSHVAHIAIRNRGTIGGSLSHADPAAELPMMMVLLDAELEIAGPTGSRSIDANTFFVGALTTVLEPDEMVVRIRLPFLPAGSGWEFQEVARRSGDFALAGAASILTATDGTVNTARVAVLGVDETPLRILAAEDALRGNAFDEAAVAQAARSVQEAVEPKSDLHGSADYRRHLIGVLTGRVLRSAWRRATGDDR